MKNIYTAIAIFSILFCQAQVSFSDDFESYTVGQSLGPQSPNWTTWSGTQGGADDINVSGTGAYSGTKCLYLTSTSANGGPNDLVLPFSGPHNTGTFSYSHYIKVASGKIGYFNFQANNTVGQIWALNCDYAADGKFFIYDNNNVLFEGTYQQNVYFQFTLEANLNTNSWTVKVNGTAVGTFQNSTYQIASINYYCPNNNASFWIDDVSFSHTPFTPSGLNGAVSFNMVDNGLVGQTRVPQVSVRNLGQTPITSFTLTLNNNGTQSTQNISGVNIVSLAVYPVAVTNSITLVNGLNTLTASISNVNGGGADAVPSDDSKIYEFTPVTPATDKLVVCEEGTGTWCQWCPRGAVFMDLFQEKFEGFFQAIAVHNADPMADATWDAGLGTIAGGYPSAVVDRGADKDPSQIEPDILTRVQTAPYGKMRNGATWDPNTRTLNVSLFTTALQNMSGNYKLACALVEDSVRGTGSGYNQQNAYAGGGNGVMGGFELKPNPVPAAQMVYNHVGRVISPSFEGLSNAFGTATAGDTFYHCFTFTLPAAWNTDHIHIVGMLIAPDGKIDNGSSTSIQQAIDNGYSCEVIIGTTTIEAQNVHVYPNPSNGVTNIFMNLSTTEDIVTSLYTLDGRQVMSKTYQGLTNTVTIPVVMNHLENGLYILKVQIGTESKTFKIENR